jgi:hypothetical protein
MKLTETEHSSLKQVIERIKKVESAIAQLSLQKSNAVDALRAYTQDLSDFKDTLTEKYGDVQINVATGNFTKTNEETK